MTERANRRMLLAGAGAGALVALSRLAVRAQPEAPAPRAKAEAVPAKKPHPPKEGAEEVSAVEDLMREHGVIRRALVIYREAAARLRARPASVPPEALQKTARLLRTFGEDYHEKQLEELHIFPALKKGPAALGGTVDTLVAQHQRGREITEYVLAVAPRAGAAPAAEALASALESFARMYEAHAAIEDTLVFPAWKRLLSPKALDEMAERFEEIEHKTFGKDGFDEAVEQVGAIERTLGLELGALTPPAPKS